MDLEGAKKELSDFVSNHNMFLEVFDQRMKTLRGNLFTMLPRTKRDLTTGAFK